MFWVLDEFKSISIWTTVGVGRQKARNCNNIIEQYSTVCTQFTICSNNVGKVTWSRTFFFVYSDAAKGVKQDYFKVTKQSTIMWITECKEIADESVFRVVLFVLILLQWLNSADVKLFDVCYFVAYYPNPLFGKDTWLRVRPVNGIHSWRSLGHMDCGFWFVAYCNAQFQ